MSEPILLALSDISTIAVFAICAAFTVSPPSEFVSDAAKLVAVSMYSFAESPASLYAVLASCKI